MKILFANIGWMTHYQGNNASDTIKGGGSHPDERKHETFNFMPLNGYCMGYVQPQSLSKGIDLKLIDNSASDSTDRVKDALVVWIAPHNAAKGTYVVGWYKNATIYRYTQASNDSRRDKYSYNIKAKAADCVLLPVDQRTIIIPRRQTGFVGQSNLWYAGSKKETQVKMKVKEVLAFIEGYKETWKRVKTNKLTVDEDAKQAVEKAAIDYVSKSYKRLGYKIIDRQKDNVGWDLDAINGKIELHLEVKGLAGCTIAVHVTNNEHDKMMSDSGSYRLCIVINALKTPELFTFIKDEEKWVSEEDPSLTLSFKEVGYIATLE